MYIWVNALFTCVTCYRKREQVENPSAGRGSRVFLKRKVPSLFFFLTISEFLWGIQVHHRQLTIKCMGGIGRVFWRFYESPNGAQRGEGGKNGQEGGENRGRGCYTITWTSVVLRIMPSNPSFSSNSSYLYKTSLGAEGVLLRE